MTYLHTAKKAAQEERDNNWLAAHHSWELAAEHARRSDNRAWAQARSNYCRVKAQSFG